MKKMTWLTKKPDLICRISKSFFMLFSLGVDPHGVILESPFNNIRDAALSHPFAAVSLIANEYR